MTATPLEKSTAAARYTPAPSFLARIFQNRYAGALISLVIVGLFLTLTQPVFLTWPNLMNIVKSNSVVFVLALGATYVVISGGVDLSVASASAASAMIFGLTLLTGVSAPIAIVAALLFGAFLGAINGFAISYLKISFFVVTLGTLSMFQSFSLIINDGTSVSVFATAGFKPLNTFVNGSIGPFPIILVFDLALLLIAGGILRYTAFGRALYAIGSNQEAARLNGINVRRVVLAVFIIAGLMAALGSIVQVGRLTSASADVDPTLLMTVLAAVLIGGTAFTGGEGGVFGTMIGVLFLGVIQNGLTLSGVSSFWQGMVSGGILILAVWLGGLRQILRRRRQSAVE
ncbi:ABC transporter permease [Martelella soudanensis]|uniref:ABC transporter permease n=1 Tax=unclassified Martelella TaxID=2629616 RepID=UPI0015DF2101|nr:MULTISPECIES: ABC transporter permease [unclassified Martelella]